jgi:hypothetical protein
MASIIDLFKTECIRSSVFHRAAYKTIGDVEFAVPTGSTGTTTGASQQPRNGPAVEFEQAHDAALTTDVSPHESGRDPGRLTRRHRGASMTGSASEPCDPRLEPTHHTARRAVGDTPLY